MCNNTLAIEAQATLGLGNDTDCKSAPNGVAATLICFHPGSLRGNAVIPYRLKAWGLLIPYRGLKIATRLGARLI